MPLPLSGRLPLTEREHARVISNVSEGNWALVLVPPRADSAEWSEDTASAGALAYQVFPLYLANPNFSAYSFSQLKHIVLL